MWYTTGHIISNKYKMEGYLKEKCKRGVKYYRNIKPRYTEH
jgi:hypothetical protein